MVRPSLLKTEHADCARVSDGVLEATRWNNCDLVAVSPQSQTVFVVDEIHEKI